MSESRRSFWSTGLAVIAAVGVVLGVMTASPAQAANPSEGFNAGNIIDDALFYDGNALNVSEVQAFLDKRVPRCTIGDPGRIAGSKYGNTTIANKCLREFRMDTASRAADSYCSSYVGRANESAAEIIVRVGQACGISQKVLLVMLEKEQGLVGDTWPTVMQFDFAMGYACPDTAPCDATLKGLYQQIYKAAWQLKVYKQNPAGFNYKPYETNTILYHPEAARGCGTSQVYISNRATAGLYIYTPYRPNQAALNAGWGTGDACSSYGNRNFYNYYKDWFGNPVGPGYEVTGRIKDYWQSSNGNWLGAPHGTAAIVTANGGGRVQTFANGVVFDPSTGAVSAMTSASPIFASFSASGGVFASWGWPIAPAVNQGGSGQNVMQFQNGIAVESAGVANFIPGDLVPFWQGTGGFGGSLGVPSGAAKALTGGVVQVFQKGAVVKPTQGNAVLFDPRFLQVWENSGGFSSALGMPTGAAQEVSANGGGQRYRLSGGSIFRSNAGTFVFPQNKMLADYDQAGGPAGAWSWPTGKPICTADNKQCSGTFLKGIAVWVEARGSKFTTHAPVSVPGVTPGNGESVTGGTVE